jgi:hypothetical protein
MSLLQIPFHPPIKKILEDIVDLEGYSSLMGFGVISYSKVKIA